MSEERRGPSVLLIVSLCVNAALIGLIAIAFLRGFPHPPREPKGAGLSPMALMRMVPAEEDKIAAIMDKHRAAIRELRQHALQARAELFGRISAAEFDRAAFEKALADVQAADTALESETMKATAESLEALTPAERESVAAQVRKPHGPWLRRMLRRH
ncbi:MAG TPA: periplasmic heavy metal sensor [Rhizomicrobium sp.]|nr:periplasmic heavy metal sensor [Rhizomicrobium sp.]